MKHKTHLLTKRAPVPTNRPITSGALLSKTVAMVTGQFCKTIKTFQILAVAFLIIKAIFFKATSYRHDKVLKKSIWCGAGLLGNVYEWDACQSTAVKLQHMQKYKEKKKTTWCH